MRRLTVLGLGAAALAAVGTMAACERIAGGVSAPEGISMAASQDLVGTPDLVVDTRTIASSWVVREEDFLAGQCGVEEGNIPTGTHRSLRFSVLINNLGDADLYVGDPLAHMDPNGDGDFADQDGLFEFASCHAHFHFRNYATYEIIRVNADGSLGGSVQARKRGFCMLDTTPWAQDGTAPKARYYTNCGNLTIHGNQGISTGFGDMYVKQLPGQLFLLSDPNEPVPPGRYVIRITANPPFAQKKGEVCPVKDSQGLCHMFREQRYDNNVGEVVIEVPNRVGRTGYGPGAGQFKEELDAYHHPEAHGNH
ncbi:MAG TPA: lysyl oxidase family protein [Longimicrobium sp.]|uniref:lysyl oxidase family protein n=1 Tax=Longimicrobium sp. TaxID=2029185 RepID=UPI002EDB239C